MASDTLGVDWTRGNIYSSSIQEDNGEDRGRPLPKFGEWDVNNPASAEGFTVIFNKARNEKKTTGTAANMVPKERNEPVFNNESYPQRGGFAVVEATVVSGS
ncbi:RPM1-interacting protein 4 isoform X1 [Cucumis melo var. makuwa]|uniref:RPM1-interacting protein 4 isoform X1 n=1 Tax=Cucumis melo var. makuwa TaxID=1194695 RepID=A0A5A7UL43_CUCMM|nr:RPM1-interacting protein 4 isoform X1 [Cucumis melo var. makuwa]